MQNGPNIINEAFVMKLLGYGEPLTILHRKRISNFHSLHILCLMETKNQARIVKKLV